MTLYANTKKQILSEHSALIGLLAEKIMRTIYPGAPEQLFTIAKWSGFLHDLGKIDPNFQQYLQRHSDIENQLDGAHIDFSKQGQKKFNWGNYPRHNELSWLLLLSLFSNEKLRAAFDKNIDGLDILLYAIYWHHAKPLRDVKELDTFKSSAMMMNIPEIEWIKHPDTIEKISLFLSDIQRLTKSNISIEPKSYIKNNQEIPLFKYYNEHISLDNIFSALTAESYNALTRSCLVCADRIISSMTSEEVHDWLEIYHDSKELPDIPKHPCEEELPALRTQIENAVTVFNLDVNNSARNREQDAAAENLVKHGINVLYGPAGCGKTKIILQTLLKKSATRTFIFVPRVAIGHSLFYELIEAYKVTKGVELYTGDLKLCFNEQHQKIEPTPEDQHLQGTLVITTIDQLCGITLSHKNIDLLTEVMGSNVVFDEFHELMDIPAIILLFFEFMKLRAMSKARQTLLVSATPNPFLLKYIDTLEDNFNAPPLEKRLCKIPTFNKKPYLFQRRTYHLESEHPFLNGINIGDIAVSNKVSTAQYSAIKSIFGNIPTLCFHSKYTPEHKTTVLNDVMKNFGKNSGSNTHALFAGPIVQASLNITTRTMHTDACTAENFLQRLGRVNRFGSFDEATILMYDVIDPKNGIDKIDTRLLNQLNQAHRSQAWLNWCIQRNLYGTRYLEDMYKEYDTFHQTKESFLAYLDDFKRILRDSVILFKNHSFDPVQYPPPKKTSIKKLSSNSLRGSSYYVLPMVYKVKENSLKKEWLFDDNGNALLTDDLMFLMGLNDIDLTSYLEYLTQADVNTLTYKKYFTEELSQLKTKKRLTMSFWKNQARSARVPIVLTFEGSLKRQPFEKIYLQYKNTWIGLIPRDLGILNLEDKELLK